MINILRTPQVRAAQKGVPTGVVYKQNEERLNAVGAEVLQVPPLLQIDDEDDNNDISDDDDDGHDGTDDECDVDDECNVDEYDVDECDNDDVMLLMMLMMMIKRSISILHLFDV